MTSLTGAKPGAKPGDKARVFFALWPDAPVAARMHAIAWHWQQGLGGRVMREDSLHATLVFIGDIEVGRLAAVCDLASGIESPGFEMLLDAGGCWHHNHIAYLAMRCIPEALQSLHLELASGLRTIGIETEKRPLHPHVTLIRKAECERFQKQNPASEPVAWTVRDFVLVKSSLSANGSRYEQLGKWQLR
jgi:2'-5' RNA ligase